MLTQEIVNNTPIIQKILFRSLNSPTGEKNCLEAGRQKNSTSRQVIAWVIRIHTIRKLLTLYFGKMFAGFHSIIPIIQWFQQDKNIFLYVK